MLTMETKLESLVSNYSASTGQRVKYFHIHPELGYIGTYDAVWATVRPYGAAYRLTPYITLPDGFVHWFEQRLWI